MVERIIKNRVYPGEAYRGENVNTNAHEPIVSAAEWQAANLAPVRSDARSKQPNLLGGIVRCAALPLRARAQPAAGARCGGRHGPSYRCRTPHAAGRLPGAREHQQPQARPLRGEPSGASRWPRGRSQSSRTPKRSRGPRRRSQRPKRS